MKLKAVILDNFPEELAWALDRIRPIIMERVVGPILHRPGFGSAEFYVQRCDYVESSTHEPMCEVRLSGVSLTDDRSTKDFYDARDEIEKIYAEILAAHLGPEISVQLMVCLMLDSPLNGSTIVEGKTPAITVVGKKQK